MIEIITGMETGIIPKSQIVIIGVLGILGIIDKGTAGLILRTTVPIQSSCLKNETLDKRGRR